MIHVVRLSVLQWQEKQRILNMIHVVRLSVLQWQEKQRI